MKWEFSYTLALIVAPVCLQAQEVTTYGDCSPVVQNVGGDVTVVCYKDQSQKPKFRVVYYRLGGVGQSFLLNGKLSPEWERYLGGQQAIVNNAVHKEIRFLTDRFGQRIGGNNLYGNVAFEGGDYGVGLADYAKQVDANIKVFQGDAGDIPDLKANEGWRVFDEGQLFVPDIEAAETLFLKGGFPKGYHAFWGTSTGPSEWVEDGVTLTAPTLWRPLTLSDLDRYEERYATYLGRALDISRDAGNQSELQQRAERGLFANAGAGYSIDYKIEHQRLEALRYLSRNGLPEGFAVVRGEPGAHYGWAFSVNTRSADLLVAVLENVGDQVMDVGAFTIAQTDSLTLRRHDETQALLSKAEPVDQRLWPPGVLAPGEKLVIPVRIEMPLFPESYDWVLDGYRTAYKSGESIREDAHTNGKQPIMFVHPFATDNALFTLDPKQMPKGRIPDLEERFEYGPAWAIQAVEVDGTTYDFRQHDPNNFILFAGGGIGSCPYVYTYHTDGDVWVEENHLLLGATSPDKKRTDRLQLTHFEGQLEIRELEHEVAYLDQISLILRDAHGEETVYPAIWPQSLTREDDQNLVLGYGQKSEVRFDLPAGVLDGKTAFLSATGYYVPLSDPALFASRAQ